MRPFIQWQQMAWEWITQMFLSKTSENTNIICASTELVHFRHRIGVSDVELTLAGSIRVNEDHHDQGTFDTSIINSTVHEKNVTYPTDAKLLKKVFEGIRKIVTAKGLLMRYNYTRRLKAVYRDQHFRPPPETTRRRNGLTASYARLRVVY